MNNPKDIKQRTSLKESLLVSHKTFTGISQKVPSKRDHVFSQKWEIIWLQYC
jgi:hypothetical protein